MRPTRAGARQLIRRHVTKLTLHTSFKPLHATRSNVATVTVRLPR